MTSSPAPVVRTAAFAEDITFTAEEELAAYRAMLRVRRFDEKAGQLVALGAIRTPCALSIGREAVVVGMTMAMGPADRVVAAGRGQSHLLALGVEPEGIMAELLGRASGLCGGKGGADYMAAPQRRFMGTFADAATAGAVACGIAFAAAVRKSGAACLCYAGEVPAAKAGIADAWDMAAERALPVVFIIENTASMSGTVPVPGNSTVPWERVDGTDVRKVRSAGRRVLERARSGEGPSVIEVFTHPFRGHAAPAEAKPSGRVRRREEIDAIAKARHRILEARIASEAALRALERGAREEVNAATAAARAAPLPVA